MVYVVGLFVGEDCPICQMGKKNCKTKTNAVKMHNIIKLHILSLECDALSNDPCLILLENRTVLWRSIAVILL